MTEQRTLDFYAAYHGIGARDASRIGGEAAMDVYARLQLLTLTLLHGSLKKVGRRIYRELVHQRGGGLSEYDRRLIAERGAQMDRLGIKAPSLGQLNLLPDGAFTLQFTMTLAKPYLSKDDEPLYIIDNPVVKDRVFRVPMVRASSWKGTMRSATRLILDGKDVKERIVRLFGSEKGDEPLKAGRLIFYTTFFDRIDLEIINPHDRERKAGINPIPIEAVPIGAQGQFFLLYAPFDFLRPSQEGSESTFRQRLTEEVCADVRDVVKALRALMLDLGFSAKRTSGYGVIRDDNLNGTLRIKTEGRILRGQFNTFSELEQLVEVFHERMRGEQSDG